jgi:hypothetical protein
MSRLVENAIYLKRNRYPHLPLSDCVRVAAAQRREAAIALYAAGAEDPESAARGSADFYRRRAGEVESKLETRRPVCRERVTSRPAAQWRGRCARPRARSPRSSRGSPSRDPGESGEPPGVAPTLAGIREGAR